MDVAKLNLFDRQSSRHIVVGSYPRTTATKTRSECGDFGSKVGGGMDFRLNIKRRHTSNVASGLPLELDKALRRRETRTRHYQTRWTPKSFARRPRRPLTRVSAVLSTSNYYGTPPPHSAFRNVGNTKRSITSFFLFLFLYTNWRGTNADNPPMQSLNTTTMSPLTASSPT